VNRGLRMASTKLSDFPDLIKALTSRRFIFSFFGTLIPYYILWVGSAYYFDTWFEGEEYPFIFIHSVVMFVIWQLIIMIPVDKLINLLEMPFSLRRHRIFNIIIYSIICCSLSIPVCWLIERVLFIYVFDVVILGRWLISLFIGASIYRYFSIKILLFRKDHYRRAGVEPGITHSA
jgi:hypothetical protein